MNNKLNKKLNPYLYPFKMKSHDILYPQIIFPSPATQYLNKKSINPFQVYLKSNWSLQTKHTNLDKHNIALEMTQAASVTSTRPDVNTHEPKYKTLEEPTLSKTALKQLINTALCGPDSPKPISFERPKSTNVPGKVQEVANWTRIDRAQEKQDMVPIRLKVVMGVVSGTIATIAVHPLDVIKVRLQLFPKKVATTTMLHRITMCEGTRGLYAGLTAGVLRQLTYTGARLYVYYTLYDKYKTDHDRPPGFSDRLQIGVVAGMAGAFMATPSDMVLVRMIEVRRLRRSLCSPPCSMGCKHVQNPGGVFFQLLRIARSEGVAMLWRGGLPTVLRSIFITTAQVGVYTEIREAFTKGEYMDTGIQLHLYSAAFSSLVSAVLSLPVDNVKTRYQSYQERHRRGMDILRDMLRKKGVRYLWKGMLPYYVRQVIHTVITYVVLDMMIDEYVTFQEATLQRKK